MHFARALLLVVGLAGLAGLSACGGDSFASKCKDSCSAKDCDGNTPTASEVSSCETSCDHVVALNKASGCESKADAVSSCDSGDQCSTTSNTDCNDEAAAYVACLTAYCSAHSSDTNCSG